MPSPPPRFLAVLWTLAAVLLFTGWLTTRGEPTAAFDDESLVEAMVGRSVASLRDVRSATTSPHSDDTVLELHLAAREGLTGTVVVDLGLVEV